jgi:hypothetical protein
MGIYYQDNTVEIRVYSEEEHNEIRNSEQIKSEARRKFNKYQYEKHKRQTDPLWKLRQNIRCLIRTSMKNNKFSKKTKTYDILGCSYDEFKKHIEQQFREGMSWENYGEWEYDHITPVSWAITEEEIIKLNHYTNLQPLWRKENIAKNNKFSG